MAPSNICVANFNPATQCPQVYLYALSIVSSVVLLIKIGYYTNAIITAITGFIATIILIGINICNWNFQWVSWIFAIMALLNIIVNVLLLFKENKTIISIINNDLDIEEN